MFLNPGPYISTYLQTKAFIDQYTKKAWAQEYSKTGAHFHVSHPVLFCFLNDKSWDTSLFVPNSDVIVDGVLRHLSNINMQVFHIFALCANVICKISLVFAY